VGVVALNIKNDEAQRLSRELADLTGESVTTAVTVAIRERLERTRRARDPQHRAAEILTLGQQIAAAISSSTTKVEDLYDEQGLPA
jgi:antitoxin VapB